MPPVRRRAAHRGWFAPKRKNARSSTSSQHRGRPPNIRRRCVESSRWRISSGGHPNLHAQSTGQQCALTLRSSGPPPAWHLAREPVILIIGLAGQAPTRRGPLSSNVRQHTEAMMVLAVAAGAAVAAKDKMPLRPRLVGHSKQTQRPRSSATVAASSTQHVGSASRRRIQPSRTAPQLSQSVGPPYGGSPCLRSSLVGQDADTTACSGLRSRRVCGQYPGPRSGWHRSSPPRCSPTAVLPNPSLERTSTGLALGPRASQCHHPSRGPSTNPVASAQLKR